MTQNYILKKNVIYISIIHILFTIRKFAELYIKTIYKERLYKILIKRNTHRGSYNHLFFLMTPLIITKYALESGS